MDGYRFYVPDLVEQSAADLGGVTLPEEEGHHARGVLRLEVGAEVVLFDGKGACVNAKFVRVGKREVVAELVGAAQKNLPPKMQLTIATAVPKGERADWLVEQASQLNVAAIQWISCERGVVKPREGGGKMEKWRRLAIESAKQCGRTHLLEIREPVEIAAVLEGMHAERVLWLDPAPDGKTVKAALGDFSAGNVTALIGPEGGWSDGERALLEQFVAARKVQRVRLTTTVLRIETACAAIAACVMAGD